MEFYVEKLVFCLTGPYLTRRARHIEPPFSVGEVREVVEHLPRGGFTDAEEERELERDRRLSV